MELQVPILYQHRNRGTKFYPQTLGSLLIDYYDSEGYAGGIQNASTKDLYYVQE
jgi:hypothetical protein